MRVVSLGRVKICILNMSLCIGARVRSIDRRSMTRSNHSPNEGDWEWDREGERERERESTFLLRSKWHFYFYFLLFASIYRFAVWFANSITESKNHPIWSRWRARFIPKACKIPFSVCMFVCVGERNITVALLPFVGERHVMRRDRALAACDCLDGPLIVISLVIGSCGISKAMLPSIQRGTWRWWWFTWRGESPSLSSSRTRSPLVIKAVAKSNGW